MVNWQDPVLLLNEYCTSLVPSSASIALDGHIDAFLKLNHAIIAIYMCVRLHGQKSSH